MRKLREAEKLSSSTDNLNIRCIKYLPSASKYDRMNWEKIEQHYQIDTGSSAQVNFVRFLHMMVHSFVFVENCDNNEKTIGFYFTSEYTKEEGLWLVNLEEFCRVCKLVAEDNTSSARYVRDVKNNEYLCWRGNGKPPKDWTSRMDKKLAKILRTNDEELS